MNSIRAEFTVAAIELIDMCEPRAAVDSIDFVQNEYGKTIAKVVIAYHGDN